MTISPTSTSSQSSSEQPLFTPYTSSNRAHQQFHQKYEVSNRKSQRQPAVIEKKSVAKIPGFFEGIPNLFKTWKVSRKEAALKKSGDRAELQIFNGLSTNDFKKVHHGLKRLENAEQGLKRLENAEQKFSNMGGQVEEPNERSYSKKALKRVIYELHAQKLKSNDPDVPIILNYCDSKTDESIDRYSDKRTLFHQLLTKLNNVGLISSGYFSQRKGRINALDGSIKDSLRALKDLWVEKKAEAGDTEAMVALGRRCYDGNGGIDQGQRRAIELWGGATLLGNPEAMVELGRCHYFGVGPLEEDPDKAIGLWEDAMQLGNSDAMVELGRCHYKGDVVPQNKDRAIELWGRAAYLENPEAEIELSNHYFLDDDLEQAEAETLAFLKRRAADGSANAQHLLNFNARYQPFAAPAVSVSLPSRKSR